MTLDPPRRTFPEPPKKKGVKDVDAATRAQNFKALGWALYGGIPIGGAAGFAAGHPFLGLVLGPLIIWTVTVGISSMAGRGAGQVYMPSGSSTPRRREYSRAEALSARGDFQGAVIAFETAILDDPADLEPYLRIARLSRDRLDDPEEALQWFRRGLGEAEVTGKQEMLVRRETAELIMNRLGEPRRAAPELARLAERFPDTGAGLWAKEELARIKEEMARED